VRGQRPGISVPSPAGGVVAGRRSPLRSADGDDPEGAGWHGLTDWADLATGRAPPPYRPLFGMPAQTWKPPTAPPTFVPTSPRSPLATAPGSSDRRPDPESSRRVSGCGHAWEVGLAAARRPQLQSAAEVMRPPRPARAPP
jgi:hypothetical protein